MHNIYNNIVISNTIESHLLTQLNLNNYVTLDTTLEAKPGMIVRQHTYSARGKVEDLAMGQGNTEEVEVDYISKDFEVKVVQGKGSWYDEMSATDDQLVPNLLRGMGEAMANDITEKAIAAMDSTELVHDMTNWGYHDFCDALALWPHEKEDVDFIIVHTNMVPAIRKAFDKDLRYVEDFVRYGQVGSINGVPVVASKACPENCGFMGSKKAVRTFYKRGIQMEKDRDADTRKNYIYARAVMMTYLYDATRMIKLQAGVIPPAPVGLQDIDFDVKSDIELPYVITCDEEYDSIGSVTLTVSDDSKEITLTESGEHTVDHGVYGTDTIKVSIPYEKQECEFTKDDGPHIELKPVVCEALYEVDIDIKPDDAEETYTKNGDYEIDHANYGKDTIHVEIPFEQQEHEITKDSEAENIYTPTEPFEGMDEVKVNITPDPVEKEYNHEGTYTIDHGIYGEDTITVDIPTQRKEIEIHPDSLPKTIVRPDADMDFLDEVEINITPHEVEKEYTKNGEYKILHGVFGNDVIHVDVQPNLTHRDVMIDKNVQLPYIITPENTNNATYDGFDEVKIDLKPYNTTSEFNQNGTYVVDRGIYGVDQITIDVEGGRPLTTRTFTANGTYDPVEGTDGYSQVIVNVEGGSELQEKTIRNNGTFVPDGGYDGFSKVKVNVQPNLQNKTITENGEYTCDRIYDGLGTITVNVEGGGGGPTEERITTINSDSDNPTVVLPTEGYTIKKNTINIEPVDIQKEYTQNGEYEVDLGAYGSVNVKVDTGEAPVLGTKNVMINASLESPVHFEPAAGFDGISSGNVYITKHNTSDKYTENGTYTIDHGCYGTSQVVVDVPSKPEQEKNIYITKDSQSPVAITPDTGKVITGGNVYIDTVNISKTYDSNGDYEVDLGAYGKVKTKVSIEGGSGRYSWAKYDESGEIFIEYVVSDIPGKYPNNGIQDGYWYIKITSEPPKPVHDYNEPLGISFYDQVKGENTNGRFKFSLSTDTELVYSWDCKEWLPVVNQYEYQVDPGRTFYVRAPEGVVNTGKTISIDGASGFTYKPFSIKYTGNLATLINAKGNEAVFDKNTLIRLILGGSNVYTAPNFICKEYNTWNRYSITCATSDSTITPDVYKVYTPEIIRIEKSCMVSPIAWTMCASNTNYINKYRAALVNRTEVYDIGTLTTYEYSSGSYVASMSLHIMGVPATSSVGFKKYKQYNQGSMTGYIYIPNNIPKIEGITPTIKIANWDLSKLTRPICGYDSAIGTQPVIGGYYATFNTSSSFMYESLVSFEGPVKYDIQDWPRREDGTVMTEAFNFKCYYNQTVPTAGFTNNLLYGDNPWGDADWRSTTDNEWWQWSDGSSPDDIPYDFPINKDFNTDGMSDEDQRLFVALTGSDGYVYQVGDTLHAISLSPGKPNKTRYYKKLK